MSPTPQSDWLTHIKTSFEDETYALAGGEGLADTVRRGQNAIAHIANVPALRPAAVSHVNLIASLLHRLDPAFGFEDWHAMANSDLFKITFENNQPQSFGRIEH